ncbi:hypothetical protein [Thalassomonas sp. RHCl1]|uniref:hypothetical protein n=1 Tax=Thalassomonas sp. RHCl1 TaxID=2995320 RepID=UPI00248AB2A1|nr:hypothetical protein [Thalassomonas sp. RHCl1]
MEILAKSDSEILQIAESMWDDIVKGANEKNWALFSKYMPAEGATDEARKDVEKQWQQVPVLTSLTTKREFVGILRRRDSVLVLWKQWSTKEEGEFLAMLNLQTINSEVKSIGMSVN